MNTNTAAAIIVATFFAMIAFSEYSSDKLDAEKVKAGLQQCKQANAILWEKECKE